MTARGPVIKLVIFAFVTVMLTALLARTIHGFQGHDSRTYVAQFTDATKLAPGDDVRLAGVAVGRVSSVGLNSSSRAQVRFTVDRSVQLTTTSSVVIRYRNLIGERYLALEVPNGGRPLAVGQEIPLSRTRSALDLTAVFNGFQPLFQGLDSSAINSLSLSLVRALQGEGGTLASLLSGTGALGRTVASRDATIGKLVTDLTAVLDQVNERSRPFNELVDHLDTLSRDVAADRNGIVDALAAIDRLSTTTDTLLTRAEPGLKQTIAGLGSITASLDGASNLLAQKLTLLPVKLNAILRAAQYGSWFQFYSCGLGVRIDVPGQAPISTPPSPIVSPICGG